MSLSKCLQSQFKCSILKRIHRVPSGTKLFSGACAKTFCSLVDLCVCFTVKPIREQQCNGARRGSALLQVPARCWLEDTSLHLRQTCRPGSRKNTLQLYDLWHVGKSVVKALKKVGKEKGCEIINDWIPGIKKRLYWCATSTMQGFSAMMLAKWKSQLRHVSGKHKDHPDPNFPECAHGELTEERRWIRVGRFPKITANTIL